MPPTLVSITITYTYDSLYRLMAAAYFTGEYYHYPPKSTPPSATA
jgi:hypothetical protein